MVTSQKPISAKSKNRYERVVPRSFGQKEDDDKVRKDYKCLPHQNECDSGGKRSSFSKYLWYHHTHWYSLIPHITGQDAYTQLGATILARLL